MVRFIVRLLVSTLILCGVEVVSCVYLTHLIYLHDLIYDFIFLNKNI